MTLKEKVAEVQPEDINADAFGGVEHCPFKYPFLHIERCPYPERYDFENICLLCWNREYTEPEEKME